MRDVLDRADEDFAHPGDQHGDGAEHGETLPRAPARPVAFLELGGLRGMSGKQLFVRAQREYEAESVGDHQDDRDLDAQAAFAGEGFAARQVMVSRGRQQRSGGEQQHGSLAAGRCGVERLRRMTKAAGEQRDPEHQQEIADDRTRDRGLDDADEPAAKRRERDDHLGGVAERGVQQAADAGAGSLREPFRRSPEPGGKRHDRQASRDEDRDVPVRSEPIDDDRRRQESQQPFDARPEA